MNSNTIEELRNMAADKEIDSDIVLRSASAVIADTAVDVGQIKIEQKAQGLFNVKISKDVEANTKTLGNYNTAVKTIIVAIILFILTAVLAQLFG